ncbi:MAG: RHS repeat-associated core domain-containing protein [Caulobacteraceae bacterium]
MLDPGNARPAIFNNERDIPYDALGRRDVLTFHDGSTQSYGYDNADRVTSIAHVFPNDAADNLTLTYTYDPAGRETGRTTSNAAYRYIPAVASTAYAAANALNQYPSVASYPYSYWPEGGLYQDEARQNRYNELGKLTFAYITPTPGVIDTSNWWKGTVDPLGHLMQHIRHPAAGVPYPNIQHSTDGLRPETVLDWQYQVPVSGPTVLQGVRKYVLGPDPDERWAFIDLNGTVDSPHVDRDGTIVALSNGGTVAQKYAYDAYGGSAAPLSDVGPGSNTYPFRYTGQRLDPGTGLYDYKARDYSPPLGRFLQPDPAGTDQGPNLYEYVADDPVNRTDPSGRQEEEMEAEPPLSEILGEQESAQRRDEIRGTNPAYGLSESPSAMAARLQQYDIFGRGNLNGSSTDVVGQSTSPVAERIQGVLSGASFQKSLEGGKGFQFSRTDGSVGAEGAFRAIAGRSSAGAGDTFKTSIGETAVSVNIYPSSGQGGDPAFRGASTVDIRTSTTVTGSRIPVQTYVKIRFPDK